MTKLWKWTIAGEFVSMAVSLFILLNSLNSLLKQANDAFVHVVWLGFGFTCALRSLLAIYAYYFFPKRSQVPKGAIKLFIVFRILGTFHWLLILALFVVALMNLLEPNAPFKQLFSKLLLYYGGALSLHTLLMIQQYRFLYYIRNNEKQRINRLIEELGD